MNCIRLRLDAAATTIVVWDGRMIIETSGAAQISRELESATGSRMFSVAKVSDKTGFTVGSRWLKAGKLAECELEGNTASTKGTCADSLKG